MLEQRHSVVVRPVSGPAEASGIDCVWPWSAGLLAVVGTAFHPVTVEVDGLVLICGGCTPSSGQCCWPVGNSS